MWVNLGVDSSGKTVTLGYYRNRMLSFNRLMEECNGLTYSCPFDLSRKTVASEIGKWLLGCGVHVPEIKQTLKRVQGELACMLDKARRKVQVQTQVVKGRGVDGEKA